MSSAPKRTSSVLNVAPGGRAARQAAKVLAVAGFAGSPVDVAGAPSQTSNLVQLCVAGEAIPLSGSDAAVRYFAAFAQAAPAATSIAGLKQSQWLEADASRLEPAVAAVLEAAENPGKFGGIKFPLNAADVNAVQIAPSSIEGVSIGAPRGRFPLGLYQAQASKGGSTDEPAAKKARTEAETGARRAFADLWMTLQDADAALADASSGLQGQSPATSGAGAAGPAVAVNAAGVAIAATVYPALAAGVLPAEFAPRVRALTAAVSGEEWFQTAWKKASSVATGGSAPGAGGAAAGGASSGKKEKGKKGGKDKGKGKGKGGPPAADLGPIVKPPRVEVTVDDPIDAVLGSIMTSAVHAALPQLLKPVSGGGLGLTVDAVNAVAGPAPKASMKHDYQTDVCQQVFGLIKSASGAKGGGKSGGKGGKGKAGKGGAASGAGSSPAVEPAAPSYTPEQQEVAKSIAPALRGPPGLAQRVVDAMPECNAIAKVEVSGPGFINIYLSKEHVAERISAVLAAGAPLPPKVERKRKVAVDYSSPNVAKEMHVGHLRSTILGDSIARMLEYCGHEVHRINHVGDWGTQFGMLIAHLKDEHPDYKTKLPDIADLTKLYKAAKARFDVSGKAKTAAGPGTAPPAAGTPEGGETGGWFVDRAHDEVVALQGGDATNVSLWKRIVEASSRMFDAVYRRLGVHPDLELRGESFYNPMLPGVVDEMEAAGMLTTDDKSKLAHIEGFNVPLIVRKRDGGYGYDSTDLAALKHRTQELECDWLVYVIDAGQALHLQLCFEGARKMGWAPRDGPKSVRIDHVDFGVVLGSDGKRFKTRSGSTVRLVDLLDEARDRTYRELAMRAAPGTGADLEVRGKRTDEGELISDLTEAERSALEAAEAKAAPAPAAEGEAVHYSQIEDDGSRREAAEKLGYSGVKYFDLKNNRKTDYQFSYGSMLSQNGDTAVYLQYQQVRLNSILRKLRQELGDEFVDDAIRNPRMHLEHVSERKLGKYIVRWPEVVAVAADTLMPHHLCRFVYELTGAISDFNRDCRVKGSAPPVARSRIALVAAARMVLREGFRLIGLDPIERM